MVEQAKANFMAVTRIGDKFYYFYKKNMFKWILRYRWANDSQLDLQNVYYWEKRHDQSL